jgi:hypothetical protein
MWSSNLNVMFSYVGSHKARDLKVRVENNTLERSMSLLGIGRALQQPWLIVTSEWYMPRSMAEFQAVDCNVTAYPVDFRTG